MFTPSTTHIQQFAENHPERIDELNALLVGNTNIYIDYANVIGWGAKLKWKVHLRKVKELYASFNNVTVPKLYFGTLDGDPISQRKTKQFVKWGYDFHTKPVKIMKKSINTSSIPSDSPVIIKDFINSSLIKQLKISTIEALNKELGVLNTQGILYLEERKCNFDVEIGRDMLLDFEKNNVDTYVLWSGDSDFADPIKQLLADGKNVVLFMTARRVATELNELKAHGLKMFEINKIRDCICTDSGQI